MPSVPVASEIGPLRAVLVHTLGTNPPLSQPESEGHICTTIVSIANQPGTAVCGGGNSGDQGASCLRFGRVWWSGIRGNATTLDHFEHAGSSVVPAANLLTDDPQIAGRQRAVITVDGAEFVRGGGIPLCMTLAVRRGET